MPYKDPAKASARNRERQREKYASDPEKYRARQRASTQRWKAKDPERWKARTAAATLRWRTKYPERQKEIARAWRERNPGYCAQYRAKNRERHCRKARENKHGSIQRYPAPEKCERCAVVMADTPKGPQFDHDHETGFHRGWLCNACNNGIARLDDTIYGLRQALAYLEKAEAAWRASILS